MKEYSSRSFRTPAQDCGYLSLPIRGTGGEFQFLNGFLVLIVGDVQYGCKAKDVVVAIGGGNDCSYGYVFNLAEECWPA